MSKFIFKIFKLKQNHLYLLIVFIFFIISYYHLSIGFYTSSDSSKFSNWADNLIKFNFDINNFFFTIPIFLIALCKTLFADKWQYIFLLFNLILVFFSMMIFAKTLLIIGVRSFLIFITLPLILISVDMLTWPRYILSDMSYAFLVILITYFMVKGFVEKKFNYLVIILTLFLILMTRPASISIILAIIFFITISKYSFFLNPRMILLFIITLFIAIPLIFGILYYFIKFQYIESTQLEWLHTSLYPISTVEVGMIIHDRPETWVDAPSNYIDVVHIYFLRLVNFFNPYATAFSKTHNILNTLQIFLIFVSISIWSLFGGNSRIQDKTFSLILILSISVAAFHSFILIDYDWRYRFPIILPLLMLFPISIEMILKKYKL